MKIARHRRRKGTCIAQEIEANLAELGAEVPHLGVQRPIHVLFVGGAYMLTQFHNRQSTNDVDILLKDSDDPFTSLPYLLFKAAVRAVAQQKRSPASWINDVIGDFLCDQRMVPEGVLWRTLEQWKWAVFCAASIE